MDIEIAAVIAILGALFSMTELRLGVNELLKSKAAKKYKAAIKKSETGELFVCFTDEEVQQMKKLASESKTSKLISFLDQAKRITA